MRQQNFIQLKQRQTQQGFSLLMVLAIMMVIAIMVVAGSQTINTEMRISANDADRKSAFSLAERALREAEIQTVETMRTDKPKDLKEYFKNGGTCRTDTKRACAVPAIQIDGVSTETVAAWERDNTFSGNTPQSAQIALPEGNTSQAPRYIYELLNIEKNIYLVRITVRAWGKNPNTRVTLQSYIEIPV